jgi:hypothetical protein
VAGVAVETKGDWSDGGRRGRNAGLARALKKSLRWALGHVQPDRTVEMGRVHLIHFPLL